MKSKKQKKNQNQGLQFFVQTYLYNYWPHREGRQGLKHQANIVLSRTDKKPRNADGKRKVKNVIQFVRRQIK